MARGASGAASAQEKQEGQPLLAFSASMNEPQRRDRVR